MYSDTEYLNKLEIVCKLGGELDCNRCLFGDAGNCAIARIDWMASSYTGNR